MEKVMESHLILAGHKCANPVKEHSQLAYMHIRHHFLANLHITETWSKLCLTNYDKKDVIGWAKAHSKTGFSVSD